MKKIQLVFSLLVFSFCLCLVTANALAGDEQQAKFNLKSILANAVPGETEGVTFDIQAGPVDSADAAKLALPWNVIPYQSYASEIVDVFEPTPRTDFTIGVTPMYLNTFFYVVNHPVTGIIVIHILYNTSGGQHQFWVHNVSDWFGEPYPGSYNWRFSWGWSEGAPDIPGNYMYLAFVIPYDGDALRFNPSARGLVNIQY